MNSLINKLIVLIVSVSLVFVQSGSYAYALPDLPEAPEMPSLPEEEPELPEQPDLPELPDNYQELIIIEDHQEPEVPEVPGLPENSENYNEPIISEAPEITEYTKDDSGNIKSNDGNDPSITTGDANNTGEIYNLGNSNEVTNGSVDGNNDVSVTNIGNGSNTNNSGSATVVNNNDTQQENSANVSNNMQQTSVSGDNQANKNIGDVNIDTGDANVSATSITAANTNIAGVSVSEFNILDNHLGDYILEFGAGCITGCGNGDITIANIENGSDSNNLGEVTIENNNDLDQLNNGNVVNNLDLIAISGDNEANKNTGGDIDISTGDANVAANLLTFLNNNIAGGVMYGVVNIFGDLIGDIILPDDVFDTFGCSYCAQDLVLKNNGNGSNTNNTTQANLDNNTNINQLNDGNIANNLMLVAETGDNKASDNTGGDVTINTGESTIDASVLNIANMNLIGENMWLVVINEAGNWIGKLFGADKYGKLAGSEGVEFVINPDGTINVTNSGNGSGSNNAAVVSLENNNNIDQANSGNIENNLNLTANTGDNEANKNTNGNINITTGDAHVLANVVNYLNNNIVGGKLLVTFVNVFGSWEGDFLTPGATKTESNIQAEGGLTYNEPVNESSNYNGGENSNNNNDEQKSPSRKTTSSVSGGSTIIVAGISNDTLTLNSSGRENEVKVAGLNIEKTETDKAININLAWVLVLLPVILATGFATRKIYLRVKVKDTL